MAWNAGAMVLYAVLAISILGCSEFFVAQSGTTSSSSGTSSSSEYVFVANATSSSASTIASYNLSSGTLFAVSGSPYSTAFGPTVLAVRPNNNLLFVGSVTTGGIYAYKIASGALTAENSGNAEASITPVAMDIDAGGSYLIALLNDFTTVVVYRRRKRKRLVRDRLASARLLTPAPL